MARDGSEAKRKKALNHFEEIRPVGLIGIAALSTLIPIAEATVPTWSAVVAVLAITGVKISSVYKYSSIDRQNLYRNYELLNFAFDVAIAGGVYYFGVTCLATPAIASAMPAAAALASYCVFKILFNGVNSPIDHAKNYMTGQKDFIDDKSSERLDFLSALKANGTESAKTLFYSLFGAGTQMSIPIPLFNNTLSVLDKSWAGLALFGISAAGFSAHAKHTSDYTMAIKEIARNLLTAAGGAFLANLSASYAVPIIFGGVFARLTSGGDRSYAEQLFGAPQELAVGPAAER